MLMGDGFVCIGSTRKRALSKSIFKELIRDDQVRRWGYGHFPEDSREYEQYILVVDGEQSLKMPGWFGKDLIDAAYGGEWMNFVSTHLNDPALMLVEVHIGASIIPQDPHQDWGDTRTVNIIIPLNDAYGTKKGGGTCVHVSETGRSVVIDKLSGNQFAGFCAHHYHHRMPARGYMWAKRRRVVIISFVERRSIGKPWDAVSSHRMEHAKQKSGIF